MTAYNVALGLSYYSTPKVACTSLKFVMFELENGFRFQGFSTNGVRRHIHSFYPSVRFSESKKNDFPAHYRFAIARDPIERFLSAYSNRVLQHNELSEQILRSCGLINSLPARPTVSQFIDHLDEYRDASPSIRHHTNPQTYFLGEDPAYFDRIYNINELKTLADFLSARALMNIKLPHEQRGGLRFVRAELTASEVRKLRDFFASDYQTFGNSVNFFD